MKLLSLVKHAAEALLAMNPKPAAIFAGNDEMATGAYVAVRRAGLRIPSRATTMATVSPIWRFRRKTGNSCASCRSRVAPASLAASRLNRRHRTISS